MKKLIVILALLLMLPIPVMGQSSKYALIVSYNGHKDSRIWASACARLLRDVLIDNGFRQKDIIFLNRVSREDVVDAVNLLKDKEGAGDTVVVAFFGHGGATGVCLYKSSISHAEIGNLLSELDSGKQLVIIDTCGSGGAIIGGYDGITLNATNRIVLTSTKAENESSVFTGHLTDWSRVVFEWGFKKGNADFNGDGFVSVQEAGSVKGGISDGYGEEFFL